MCAPVSGCPYLSIPDHYELVLLLVIVSGLGIASYHPEGFKTARFFTGDKMARGLAVFTVGGNIGLALGPITALFIITYFGLDYLPLIMVFSVIFLFLLFWTRHSLVQARPAPVSKGSVQTSNPKGAYLPCRPNNCHSYYEIVDPFWSHGLYSSLLYQLLKTGPTLRGHIGFGVSA